MIVSITVIIVIIVIIIIVCIIVTNQNDCDRAREVKSTRERSHLDKQILQKDSKQHLGEVLYQQSANHRKKNKLSKKNQSSTSAK